MVYRHAPNTTNIFTADILWVVVDLSVKVSVRKLDQMCIGVTYNIET